MSETMRGPHRLNGHLGRVGPLTPNEEVAAINAADKAYYALLDSELLEGEEPELDPTRPPDLDLLRE